MGFKVHKNTPPMEREIKYLLYDLCVKWGFCIPNEDCEFISQKSFWTAEKFAKAIVEAESLDPVIDKRWVKKITIIFQERFGNEQIDENNFIDRTRGIEESW